MAVFTIGPDDGLYYEHRGPSQGEGATFVFFNALTGDTGAWEAEIGPALREAGHGTLMWNFRGQKDSPFSSPDVISAEGIVDDAVKLIEAEAPRRPVYVGLSIGGLFAAQAHLRGAASVGSVRGPARAFSSSTPFESLVRASIGPTAPPIARLWSAVAD